MYFFSGALVSSTIWETVTPVPEAFNSSAKTPPNGETTGSEENTASLRR